LHPAGLIASCVESSDHSVSNHPSSPRCLTWFPQPGLPSCRAQGSTHHYSRHRLTSVGLRHCQQARHDDRPNRVRHPTDWSFTFRCSPPPLAGTQFRSVTGPKSGPDRDFHPAGSIHSRSHWQRASCPPMWQRASCPPMIGVGRPDWVRAPLPPNRAGGFPAHGSPVDGFTSVRIEGPRHGRQPGCAAPGR
jgi:hypothetical protein